MSAGEIKVGSGLLGKPHAFFLSKGAQRERHGACVLHTHPPLGFPCSRHHWDMLLVASGWKGTRRRAWECSTCGAGAHVEDPAHERAEREACLA